MAIKKITEREFCEVLERIMQIGNLTQESHVAELLNYSPQALSQSKKRGSLPVNRMLRVCREQGWNFEWITTGQGEMFAAGAIATAIESDKPVTIAVNGAYSHILAEQIGFNIRRLREGKGYSLAEVAKRTGFSTTQIYKYEKGDNVPGKNNLIKLAAALECSVPEITNTAIADPETEYVVKQIHKKLTPAEENALKILRERPDAYELIEVFLKLPRSKQKIRLGEMIGDLEEIQKTKNGPLE